MAEASDSKADRSSLILRAIYAFCLIDATYNHWAAIFQHGFFWDYGGFSRTRSAFWTALAFLDPATAILLFIRPKAGIAATIAIIVTDVIHNLSVQAHHSPSLFQSMASSPHMVEQIAFMMFVLTTSPFAWKARSRAGTVTAR